MPLVYLKEDIGARNTINMVDIEYIVKTVVATCMLHNMFAP